MIKSNLSKILGEKRIKQSELAKKSKVAASTIAKYYHDKKLDSYGADVLNKLCKTLDCTICDLLEYVPDNEKS